MASSTTSAVTFGWSFDWDTRVHTLREKLRPKRLLGCPFVSSFIVNDGSQCFVLDRRWSLVCDDRALRMKKEWTPMIDTHARMEPTTTRAANRRLVSVRRFSLSSLERARPTAHISHLSSLISHLSSRGGESPGSRRGVTRGGVWRPDRPSRHPTSSRVR